MRIIRAAQQSSPPETPPEVIAGDLALAWRCRLPPGGLPSPGDLAARLGVPAATAAEALDRLRLLARTVPQSRGEPPPGLAYAAAAAALRGTGGAAARGAAAGEARLIREHLRGTVRRTLANASARLTLADTRLLPLAWEIIAAHAAREAGARDLYKGLPAPGAGPELEL